MRSGSGERLGIVEALLPQEEAPVHIEVRMHGLIETLDDHGILGDVVLCHFLQAEPDLAVGLALDRDRRLADLQQTVVGVVVELVDEPL